MTYRRAVRVVQRDFAICDAKHAMLCACAPLSFVFVMLFSCWCCYSYGVIPVLLTKDTAKQLYMLYDRIPLMNKEVSKPRISPKVTYHFLSYHTKNHT